ncbi:glucans biosynthesis glucosyltransferase MdoH [uncultured Rhodoblastus sp.]|uniref:glucans biosynthesis glucosyltransferase MdoH n=1 Tax=uncultured Rhodoblastus sp. TaxID=543037 RepID=UPI0025F84A28|nr:glucans biosynthesis glucosyltransferase MdoH [uncultured Rhodoblastus sp.]
MPQNPDLTPAGLQSRSTLRRRRMGVALANLGLYAALLVWLAAILGSDGWTLLRVGIFVAFAVATPWSVLGVCNSLLGFWLLHFRADALEQAAPFALPLEASPLKTRSAILMTLRNENPARAFARLRAIKASLDALPEGAAFDFFVLSDTTATAIAQAEEAEFSLWREGMSDAERLHYRRRSENIGFKAGNIADFCEHWGGDYEFMIPLDADSLMDGATILRLARIGEAFAKIGIVQTLVVGAPSHSAFARIFQFGMRAGMRAYTMGATFWAGDCGPFWGHNALVRIAPFVAHCELPELKSGKPILSHDQIEAALMRRGGFEVRVLPVECGSFEENPPTLLDFVARETRWCRGNMQYPHLLGTPGLLPMSRFQLIWAISMFIGAPAWTAILFLAALLPATENVAKIPAGSAKALYLLFLAFYLTPKLAGFFDAILQRGGLARYGGSLRFGAGVLAETFCSFIIGAATNLNITLLLATLPFGRKIEWGAQSRDVHGVSWRAATRAFWPHLLFGVVVVGVAAAFAPKLALWSLPLTAGYFLAIPFAVASASPKIGRWFFTRGLCGTPEEFCTPEILRAVSSATEEAPKTPDVLVACYDRS